MWHWPEDDLGHINPTMQQFFLIGEDRATHGFLLGQPGNSFYVAQLGQPVPHSANLEGGSRRELLSVFNPGSDFWLIDLNSHERSPTNALDLALAAWQSYTQQLPALFATFYLDAAEAGHTFTLHSRAPGGSEQLQSVTADALNASAGSWTPCYVDEGGTIYTTDHTGADIVVLPGCGVFRAPVGLGMEFWLTRDGDGASTPVQTAINSGAPQGALFGAFPPLPPQVTRIEVRVPAPAETWFGWCFDAEVSFPITVDSSTTLYSYDDFGQVDHMLAVAVGCPAPRKLIQAL